MLNTDYINGLFKTELGIRVTIRNTSKEVCFFMQPSFKTSVFFSNNGDRFNMVYANGDVKFPIKIEVGTDYSVTYTITNEMIDMFRYMLSKDSGATILASVQTLQGEVFESKPYKIADIVDGVEQNEIHKDDPFDHFGN